MSDLDLWVQNTRDVKPLKQRGTQSAQTAPHVGKSTFKGEIRSREVRLDDFSDPKSVFELKSAPLDSSWTKKLRRGRMDVDVTVDLHGMTQDAAHVELLRVLDAGIRAQHRVILVITGRGAPKTRAEVEERIHGRSRRDDDLPYMGDRRRGVIKREVPKWIASSPYAGAVMAIRPAHPGHGGDGASYVLLKRKRS